MKRIITIIITVTCMLSYAQKVDTTPLDAYWRMIEPLKKGDSLSIVTWNNFLNIEANAIYIDNQGFDKVYLEKLRKTIEYVYMPKHDSLLKARIKKIEVDPASYWLTYKVYNYKKYETELKEYESKIKNPAYVDSIYRYAYCWLPKRLQKKSDSISIYILGIENDAIAGGNLMIFTAWSAYNDDRLRFGVLGGHEMHHVLRTPMVMKDPEPADKGIIYTLKSILNEGTADMIDKKYNVDNEDKFIYEFKRRQFLLFQADSIVSVIDQSIQQISRSNGKEFKTENEYRDLMRWSSGHCPGFYMTNIIVRNGFKKDLIEHIDDPFYFISLYNKAAKKDKAKPQIFSQTSINYLAILKKKYVL